MAPRWLRLWCGAGDPETLQERTLAPRRSRRGTREKRGRVDEQAGFPAHPGLESQNFSKF